MLAGADIVAWEHFYAVVAQAPHLRPMRLPAHERADRIFYMWRIADFLIFLPLVILLGICLVPVWLLPRRNSQRVPPFANPVVLFCLPLFRRDNCGHNTTSGLVSRVRGLETA